MTPTDKGTEGKDYLKSPFEWTEIEKKLATGNSRVANAIIVGVDEDNYMLISDCHTAKSARDILQLTFEGTNKVKTNRLVDDHFQV